MLVTPILSMDRARQQDVAALADSPRDAVRHGAQQPRRLLRAGQAQVYQRVLPGLPVALVDSFFRLDLARPPLTLASISSRRLDRARKRARS